MKNDPTYTDLILNKVNPVSNLSTLAYAILQKKFKIASSLIEFGARCFYDETNESRDLSPIFMAMQTKNAEITELMELMCDHNVSLTVKNSTGMTPLMFAAEKKDCEKVVNYLTLRTTDLNEEDLNCKTILVH